LNRQRAIPVQRFNGSTVQRFNDSAVSVTALQGACFVKSGWSNSALNLPSRGTAREDARPTDWSRPAVGAAANPGGASVLASRGLVLPAVWAIVILAHDFHEKFFADFATALRM